MIEIADKWTRQPQRPQRPDSATGWKKRLWGGSVLAAFPFNGWQNVATGPLRVATLPAYEGSVSASAAEWGVAQGTAGGTRAGRKYAGLPTLTNFTIAALVRFSSVSSLQVITGNDDANAQGVRIQCNGGSFQLTHLAQANVDLSASAFSANNAYFVAVSHNGTTDYWVVKNLTTGALSYGAVSDTFTPFTPTSGWCPVGYGRLTTESVDGQVGGAFISSAVLTQADLIEWANNPHAIFAKRPKRLFVTGAAGSPDVTLSLSGQAVAASAGTLVPSSTKTLSGQSAAVSTGTLVPNHSRALAGSTATVVVGALTPSTTVSLTGTQTTAESGVFGVTVSKVLTGSAAAAAAGTLAPTASKALTGFAATATTGTLAPSVTIGLTGTAVATASGSVSASGGGAAALTGIAATAAVGTLAPSVTVGLTGTTATAASGSVTASGPGSTALTGTAATASPGTVAPAVSVALAGSAATAAAGTLAHSTSKALAGSAATADSGSTVQSRTLALTGSEATAASGSVTVGGDRTIALTGSAATAACGSIADCGRALPVTSATLQAFAGVLTPARLQNLVGSYATAVRGTITATGGSVTTIEITSRFFTIQSEDRAWIIDPEDRSNTIPA